MNLQDKDSPDKSNQSLTISFEDFEKILSRIVSNAGNECSPEFISNYSHEIEGIISLIVNVGCPPEFLQFAQASRREIDTLWTNHYLGGVVVGSVVLEFEVGEGRK